MQANDSFNQVSTDPSFGHTSYGFLTCHCSGYIRIYLLYKDIPNVFFYIENMVSYVIKRITIQ